MLHSVTISTYINEADHGPIHIRLVLNCCMHYIFFHHIYISERVRRGAAPVGSNVLNVFTGGPIGLSDTDVYYCQGLSGAQQLLSFREGAQVTVRGKPFFFSYLGFMTNNILFKLSIFCILICRTWWYK